ncbi:MAG: hypothetical protein GQ570_03490 [Helicobacteraceae bacterium]|nr:hypothetical protein [Helicobacteraceae bacterium]
MPRCLPIGKISGEDLKSYSTIVGDEFSEEEFFPKKSEGINNPDLVMYWQEAVANKNTFLGFVDWCYQLKEHP